MYYFCTYFDHRYVSRGLALYHSLHRQCNEFSLYILCLSDECHTALVRLQLPHVTLVTLQELENHNPELLTSKCNRSLIEYYFTCTPSFLLYLLSRYQHIAFITYLDADIYFFADPTAIFQEIGENSIAIIPHRFTPRLHDFEKFGKYNVGWLSFRKHKDVLSCLDWYKSKCIEWCYDIPEDGRFADQKYLDYFPELFKGVIIIQQKGANVAPWNIENYAVSASGGTVTVDGKPIVFYHFHGLKRFNIFLFDSGFSRYKAKFTKDIKNALYIPYLHKLCEIQKELDDAPKDNIRPHMRPLEKKLHLLFPKGVNIFKKLYHLLLLIYTRTFIVYFQN